MKQQIGQELLIQIVAGLINRMDDEPAIRQTLNDTMDYFEKTGELSRSRSDKWSQERMVKAVQRKLR